jgi:putative ABC transport system ATP-binding protein
MNFHQSAGIKNINFFAGKGELVLFLGPSGSGKTTLLTLIAGLIEPAEGDLFLFNKNITCYSKAELQKIRAEKIGFVFQNFLLIESLTGEENIRLVLKFAGANGRLADEKINYLFNRFGISYLLKKFPASMSQGEKQRVAVSRAIANDADLILADEPTASLELNQGYEIIELLNSYSKDEKKCVIVASHDLRLKEYADRIIFLEDGKIKSF